MFKNATSLCQLKTQDTVCEELRREKEDEEEEEEEEKKKEKEKKKEQKYGVRRKRRRERELVLFQFFFFLLHRCVHKKISSYIEKCVIIIKKDTN